MKKYFITSGFIIALIAFASAGFSQTKTPRVHKRQVNQQERIADGVKDGELTKRETAKLEARQAKIQNDKKAAKADGVVTKKERAKLHREQKRSSRAIYRQKHDAQTKK
ncbi:MAG: hypothetical protein QM763_17765 [Agriterribacter sp.]